MPSEECRNCHSYKYCKDAQDIISKIRELKSRLQKGCRKWIKRRIKPKPIKKEVFVKPKSDLWRDIL